MCGQHRFLWLPAARHQGSKKQAFRSSWYLCCLVFCIIVAKHWAVVKASGEGNVCGQCISFNKNFNAEGECTLHIAYCILLQEIEFQPHFMMNLCCVVKLNKTLSAALWPSWVHSVPSGWAGNQFTRELRAMRLVLCQITCQELLPHHSRPFNFN